MSNEKQESLADIVADMRHGLDKSWHEIDREWVHGLPDRIEAALKREREAAPGNAAAMREALENCAKMGEQIDYQLGSSDETVYAFRGERCLGHNISKCARAALAAPARNCDVYRTKKAAEDAFLATKCDHPCGNCTVSDDFGCALVHECGVDWLFAPAKDMKGETDGVQSAS